MIATLGVAQTPVPTIRVGIFDKPSIVIAYYRSPMWNHILKMKMSELEAAKNANDTKKVHKLEAFGTKSQETANRQLTGDTPITNILEALAPAFLKIAQEVRDNCLGFVVCDATVQTVDVTDQLLDQLRADADTRKIVDELRNHRGPGSPH
jgi:hypothetical protein